MRKLIALLFCLSIFHPGFAAPMLVIEGYFTDSTNTVSGKRDITQRAERFKQQTGIAPFILLTTQDNLTQVNKALMLQSAKLLNDDNQGILGNASNLLIWCMMAVLRCSRGFHFHQLSLLFSY